MVKDKIVLVGGEDGDWEGLYVNGKLKAENHSLSAYDVLKAIEADFESIAVEIECKLPYNLGELKGK